MILLEVAVGSVEEGGKERLIDSLVPVLPSKLRWLLSHPSGGGVDKFSSKKGMFSMIRDRLVDN